MRARVFRSFIVWIIALLICPVAGRAEEATGTLTGVATAIDGARLPGVILRVHHVESGTQLESVSSESGLFRIGGLSPGRYTLAAELEGFERREFRDIVLRAGESRSLAVQLEVATVRENVRVIGVVPRDSVEATEMRESRARDVGEALGALPGVNKLRKAAIANDVVVRGFQGKDVTVLIDGQRLDGACPGHMDPPAFHVDFAEVNRVELSRGPFDVTNQGGLAGVVNIVTERPQAGWHGSANLSMASAATFAPSATASVGGRGWAALAGASMRRADPYRDGAGVLITERAAFRKDAIADVPAYDVWTGWGRVALSPWAGTNVQLSYTHQSADEILYPYLMMDAIYDKADRAGARFEKSDLPGGWQSLAVHAYYTRVDHWMTDELRTSSVNKPRVYSMGTDASTEILGARAQVARGPFSFGFEGSHRNWNTTSMLAASNYISQSAMPDVTIGVVGGFVAYSADVASTLHLETGARVDYATTDTNAALANQALYMAYHGTSSTTARDVVPAGYVRARWRPSDAWSFMAGVGHSARLPDQQERFYGIKRMGGDWVGNPTLSPSRNTGADAELRFTREGADVALTAFVYRVDDYIRVVNRARAFAVPGVMNTSARSYANVDALSRGLEVNTTLPLASSLFLSANVAMVRGTTLESVAGESDLPEIPPARMTLRLRYDRARWNAAIEGVGAAKQSRVAADLNESTTPAFAVVNFRAGLRLRPVTVTAAVDNLFDTLYAEHLSYQRDPFRSGMRVYEPGRTLSVTFSRRF